MAGCWILVIAALLDLDPSRQRKGVGVCVGGPEAEGLEA